MDLQDSLKYLADQASHAAELQILAAPGDSGRWAVVHRDGKVEWFDQQCGPRRHEAHSFDSFVRATIGLHEDAKDTWIFVPQGRDIVATSNIDEEAGPRDCVIMPVTITDEFSFFDEHPSSFDQKGLLRVLRVKLHRCGVDELISLLTHITFCYNNDGDSLIKTGKSSLSRKTVNELATKGDDDQRKELPEIVSFLCHYLEEAIGVMPTTPRIECLLEVDPTSDKPFSLVPLGGELHRVAHDTQEWIVKHLTEAFAGNQGIEVFAGEVR